MSRMSRFVLAGLAVVGFASMAGAQVCAGTPSFSTGAWRIGGAALFSQNVGSYGGNLAVGTYKGWFVSGDFEHLQNNSSNSSSSNVGGGALSYEVPLESMAHTLDWCPTVGVRSGRGSVVGQGIDIYPQNITDVYFGGTLGWVASTSGSTQILPALGALFYYRSLKDQIVYTNRPAATNSNSFVELSGSLGFVVSKQWTIMPTIRIPINEWNGKVQYGVGLTYNFNLPKALHQ